MGQVAFDTLQALEELETAGISREQARAISLVVRKSHEVADVATKRDLDDVRKEMIARFEKNEAQMEARFEKTDAQIALLRKDMEFLTSKLLINITKIILGCVGLASAVVTLIVKFL